MTQVMAAVATVKYAAPKAQEARTLADSIATYTRQDEPSEVGAAKRYNIPPGEEGAQALARLRREIDVLRGISHPGLLTVIDANPEEFWTVTEYHDDGTLQDCARRFAGKPLAALETFRTLVDAVAALHRANVVHRDIKPVNIFMARDGGLVLGDFGIVFTETGGRVTNTFEKVGTTDWVAPWGSCRNARGRSEALV